MLDSDRCAKWENKCGKGYELLGWERKVEFEKNCQERPLGEETWDRHMREAAMGISGEESSRHGKCKGPEASKCKHIQETPQRSQTWNRVGEGLLGGPKRVREEADHLGLLDPRGETTGEFLLRGMI